MSEKKYIDADIVNLKLKQICDKRNTSYGVQFGGRAKDFAQLTDDIPAADVAEVRRGEWVEDNYGYFHCSECGYEHDSPEYITPYCPNCGAKMDEEE